MSEDIGVAVVCSPAKMLAKIERFDRATMALHWLTVVLLLLQFATSLMLYWLEREYQLLILIHRTTGSFIWLVVAARLAWRHSFARLPPFPPAMSLFQRRVAMLNEYSLYLLLLLQPLTGLADSLFRGRPFDLLIWHLPALLERNKAVFGIFHKLHELGAMALLLLITVHATAALFHGLVLRDGILARMIPWTDR
jgi:cytochrome b561